MYEKDTIAAIATAVGAAGVAVIRVSGVGACDVATRVFRGWPEGAIESHRLYPGRIVDDDGGRVDRGLAVLMRAPRSYTGEDVLELHCHGGVAVARATLRVALAAGARLAERGEFTARAFLNGKLDLTQVEAVADLVAAQTEDAARVASAQLDGALSRRVASLRGDITEIAARLEAAIDFADEEDTGLDRVALSSRLAEVVRDLRSLRASYERGRILREGAKVVVAGKPNVGKSSLVNRLLGTERVIVTPVPGTTRDTIEESLDLDGIAVALTDTAGLRTTADVVERFGIERTQGVIEGADLVLLVLDASQPLDDEDRAAVMASSSRRKLLVLNKADLPEVTNVNSVDQAFPGITVVRASAMTHGGTDALRERLRATLAESLEPAPGAVLTRERQRVGVDTAMDALAAAGSSLEAGHPAEIVAVNVQAAASALEEIVGTITNEQVLDRLFREFCIGK